jgi:VWFA-related protein
MAIFVSARRSWALFACIFLFWAKTDAVATDNDQPAFTFHSQSNEVRLTFSAADRNDHGVATLRASDIVVVDSEIVVRNFASFGHSQWTKREIGIIADNSESVALRFPQEVGAIVNLLSQTEGRTEETLSVFSFERSHPALLCQGNCRESHVLDQLGARQPGELTPLFDTIIFAANSLALRGDPQAERILIVLSDGADTFSDSTLTDAIETAIHDRVGIYCVDLKNSASRKAAVLYQLSAATGGRYLQAHSGITPVLNDMLDGFRTTYTVVYSVPSHVTGFHSVRVMPTRDWHLQFRSRSGYFYPENNR